MMPIVQPQNIDKKAVLWWATADPEMVSGALFTVEVRMDTVWRMLVALIPTILVGLAGFIFLVKSLHRIGPLELGLVRLNFSFRRRKDNDDCPIAFNGEAGYQAKLLQPGLRFRPWPLFSVTKHPWTQIPTDSVGVVVAQIGRPLKQGHKTATYREEFGSFVDPKAFLDHGGEKGVQRPVLQPGTVAPIHPIAFLVLTTHGVYGIPVDDTGKHRQASLDDFGLEPGQLKLVDVNYVKVGDARVDAVGVVTVTDGDPLPAGDIACRLGGWKDVEELLSVADSPDVDIIERLLHSKNAVHSNYQNMQAFFEAGGRLGLQHDVLMPGCYALNPFLVRVEIHPMLVVHQGQVAVIKSYLGLRSEDISGDAFKHGQIVRPGRRGVWIEPLRTGKFPLNPRLYQPEIVPTAILTLNWSRRNGEHGLDVDLSAIDAKSCEGFNFILDLQVQIHIADRVAPLVISAVSTVTRLVNEVMRPAVGNFFRNKLQSISATEFIQKRGSVQAEAQAYVSQALEAYNVVVKGVFIQQVNMPDELVKVLTEREIASQQQETFERQRDAEKVRAQFELERGRADAQHELAQSAVRVETAKNNADVAKRQADGEAYATMEKGKAEAAKVLAIGAAQGEAYEKQSKAIGREATAIVQIAHTIRDGRIKIVPDVLVTGGNGSLEGLAASLIGHFRRSTTEVPELDAGSIPPPVPAVITAQNSGKSTAEATNGV